MAKYTNGTEYTLKGQPYSGPYNLVGDTGVAYTGEKYIFGISNRLKKIILSDEEIDIGIYKDLNPSFYNAVLTEPISYYPIITDDETEQGWFYRYFVQRANNKNNPIIEVKKENFQKIDSRFYYKTKLSWFIKGTSESLMRLNNSEVEYSKYIIPKIDERLKNLIEFKIY